MRMLVVRCIALGAGVLVCAAGAIGLGPLRSWMESACLAVLAVFVLALLSLAGTDRAARWLGSLAASTLGLMLMIGAIPDHDSYPVQYEATANYLVVAFAAAYWISTITVLRTRSVPPARAKEMS